ncbi:MAG: cyclase family protein, partial [Vulcanimicrobiaceae bacterium]
RINRGEAKPGEDLLVHHIVLGAGLYHVECMTNFAAIPKERFKIVVAPLNLKGIEAAPTRVFAIIE